MNKCDTEGEEYIVGSVLWQNWYPSGQMHLVNMILFQYISNILRVMFLCKGTDHGNLFLQTVCNRKPVSFPFSSADELLTRLNSPFMISVLLTMNREVGVDLSRVALSKRMVRDYAEYFLKR